MLNYRVKPLNGKQLYVKQKSGLVGAILHNLFIIPGGEQPSW